MSGCGVRYDSRVFLVCETGWVMMPSTEMGSRKSRGLGEHAELEAGHGDLEGQGASGRRRLGSAWTHGPQALEREFEVEIRGY